jgi:predicted O-methyltransferase YrrM
MGGPSDLTLLFWCAELLAATRVLETGVAYGWSTLALLASLRLRSNAILHSVDMPYVKRNSDPYVGVVVPAELRNQWVLHRMADHEGIPRALRALGGEIDMCHYDSDKSYRGRRWAYPVLWKALRSGGTLISDDVGDNLAFIEFSEDIGETPLVIAKADRYVGVLRKGG